MNKYNMGQKLISSIQQLYTRETNAVLAQGTIVEWFKTSIGVPQGCLLSATLFNIHLERIMSEALEDHTGTVRTGGRNITNPKFADDIDGIPGKEAELANLVRQLDRTFSR